MSINYSFSYNDIYKHQGLQNEAKKITNELIQRNYTGPINFGENGDALLNPDFIKIFKELTKTNGKLILFTNMKHMNKETAKTLLENGLTEITFNIDGATKETYEAAKTLCDFEKIKENVHNFIKLRDKINPKCQIHIKSLSAKRYIEFRDMLPKSKVGKLLRREIRDEDRRNCLI